MSTRKKAKIVFADMPANTVLFFSEEKFKKFTSPIRALLKFLLQKIGRRNVFIECHLVKPLTMRRINRTLRNKDEATNVISLPFAPFVTDKKGEKSYGELFLCPTVIKKNNEDLVTLVIHGFLHLDGCTHDGTRDTLLMKEREKELTALVVRHFPKETKSLRSCLKKPV